MNILLFTLHYPTKNKPHAGSFNVSRANALKKMGANVTVINVHNPCPPLKYLLPVPKFRKLFHHIYLELKTKSRYNNNIQFNWIPFPKKINWLWQLPVLHFFIGKRFKRIVEQLEPDLIITSEIHPYGTYAKYLKEYFAGPLFAISEGSDLLKMPGEYKGIESIIEIINSKCDKVLFVSKNQKAIVCAKYKIDNDCVINNGFESDIFKYRKDDSNIEPGHRFTIISVGNLYAVKGHDLLLQAVQKLQIDFQLIIVGDGDKKDEYKKYISDNNLGDKVKLLAAMPQAELVKLMLRADMCCMPSRSEGFSVAGLEALGTGLPLVATNVGAFAEIIVDGVNGFVVEKENSEALSTAINKAAHTTWNRKEIADSTRKNYSWNKWAKEIMDLYDHQVEPAHAIVIDMPIFEPLLN